MKKCFKCGEEKPLSEFYKHPRMGDGHLGKCKKCTRKDSSLDYSRKKEDKHWRIKERERGRDKAKRLGYRSSPTTEQKKVIIEKYFKNNPEKQKAIRLVNSRKKTGRLIKQLCEICGELDVQAHHDDYSKPLEVRWLCIKHHNEYHVKKREKELLKGES